MKKSLWLFAVAALCFWGNPAVAQPNLEECSFVPYEYDGSNTLMDTSFEVIDDVEIVEANVTLDMTTTFVGNTANITYRSPAGTDRPVR